MKRTRFEGAEVDGSLTSKHRREPATHECSPTKPLKSTPVRESKARSQRDAKQSDSIAISEMGELGVRPRVETRINRSSKTRAFFESWTAPSLKATRLKRPPRLSMEAKKTSVRSKEAQGIDAHHPRRFQIAPKAGCTTPKTTDSDSSFLKMSGAERTAGRRRLRRSDGSVGSVNRFGWLLSSSRKSGKGSYSAESVATRPEVSAVTVNDTTPPRPRAFFEVVGLSPIVEDAQSFPSFGDLNCSFDTFSVVRGGNFDRNVTPNGRYREQEQAYQDSDSRNFDHMNLSGSFVLQSTSCRDLSSACYPETAGEESVPALVLTFPTPEPPKSPVFIPQSPFTVHKFVAAMAPGPSASAECIAQLAVPALPRCTHCGFGFGLDLDDLEAPLSSNPCRFCEPQWLACKMWYQARGDRLREPCAVRPAESNASRRAIVGKLGLPVGSHRGLGLGTGTGVDEMGQMDDKQAATGRGAEGYGYSRFSNVIIKDRTRTTKRTAAAVWRKVTRLFDTQGRGRAADRYSRHLDARGRG
ncbi:hypothetical protein DFH08DRAFT_843615 [Mycena albidolilacea]|uniref:Uncharacterized protein n=1 Tax=Mycena albidolilacea TaxID=1033008 RepID=A0AAD7F090_9AGAR|nr:hypothetical protein DFH08DRAFT_843615 [Mycena albidolilacea]